MAGIDKLRSNLAGQAQAAASGFARTKEGLVTSYDPDTYSVKVMLQPEETETGWMPIKTLLAGQGWGVYFGPALGDSALVAFPEGDELHPVCLGFLANDQDVPPTVPSGELLLAHKSGAFLRFTNDGKIISKGPWEHDGTFKASGDITDNWPSNAVTIKILRTKYNEHKHPETGSITGVSDKPAT